MVLDNLLDLRLNLRGNLALGDLLEESALSRGEVSTELAFPAGDLVDGDGVKLWGSELVRCKRHVKASRATYKTVDTSVDDGDLDLHRKGLVLTLLCKGVSGVS